jgi:hypothetical protein
MAITRLSIENPAADAATEVFQATGAYVVSVIAANLSNNDECNIDIWISPDDTETESLWGYIVKNLQIDPSDSFETFRFAVNADDYLYVRSNRSDTSFTTIGASQAS